MATASPTPLYHHAFGVALGGNITASANGAAFDTAGLNRAVCIVTVSGASAGTSGTISFSLEEDDNSGFSSATAISGSATTALTVDSGGATGKKWAFDVQLAGRERYLRLVATKGGTTITTLNIAAVWMSGATNGPVDVSTGASGAYQELKSL